MQTLMNMSKSVTNKSNEPAFTFHLDVDYNKAALLFRFFPCDKEKKPHPSDKISIENDTVHMEYDASDGSCTGLAYAAIPLRFLPDKFTQDWKSPDVDPNISDTKP